MRSDHVLCLTLAVGAVTWAFRYLPLRVNLKRMRTDGALARFLAATGPAAIATLFVAAILSDVQGGVTPHSSFAGLSLPLPLIAGALATAGLWFVRHSVVMATLGGALAYGLVFALVA